MSGSRDCTVPNSTAACAGGANPVRWLAASLCERICDRLSRISPDSPDRGRTALLMALPTLIQLADPEVLLVRHTLHTGGTPLIEIDMVRAVFRRVDGEYTSRRQKQLADKQERIARLETALDDPQADVSDILHAGTASPTGLERLIPALYQQRRRTAVQEALEQHRSAAAMLESEIRQATARQPRRDETYTHWHKLLAGAGLRAEQS